MFILVLALFVFVAADQAPRPVIAIFTNPLYDVCKGTNTTSSFEALYAQWLRQGGARVVPLRYDANEAELRDVYNKVNGIVFTGGGQTLGPETLYFQSAQKVFDWVVEETDSGKVAPAIWGTCQGFQLLSILGAQNHSILEDGFDSWCLSLPLNFTSEAKNSRMLGSDLPEDIREMVTTKNITCNLHHFGVTPETFKTNPNLLKFYRAISTNQDRKGLEFVSSLEARNYPIFGSQWHTERPQFEWSESLASCLSKTPESFKTMAHFSRFFVEQAAKCPHSYPSREAEEAALCLNRFPLYTGEGDSIYCY